MAAWTLSAEEWDALDKIRFGTTDKTVFRNATIILMSAVGRSKFSIAHDLGCSPATVDNIRKHYRQHGAARLKLYRAVCLQPSLARGAASRYLFELAQTGGISSCEQPRSNNRPNSGSLRLPSLLCCKVVVSCYIQ